MALNPHPPSVEAKECDCSEIGSTTGGQPSNVGEARTVGA